MRYTFNKKEKLKSTKAIELLFKEGKSIKSFPLRMVYLKADSDSLFNVQAAFSVSKKRMKKAIDRNRIKRLMREAYRLNKHMLYENLEHKYYIMFTLIDEKQYKYVEIEEKMILLLKKLINLSNAEENEI